MKPHPNRLWLVAILLGWIFDFLFWKQDAGVNFALFLTLCLLGGLSLLLADGLRPAPKSLWLLIPFAFFAVVTFLRQEPLTIFLATTFTLFSLGVFASTYLGGRWMEYGLAEYLSRFLHILANMFILPRHFIGESRKQQAVSGEPPFPLVPILRGLLIALPVVAGFASLLANADAIFDQKLAEHFEDFHVLRPILILAMAYLVSGVILHTFHHSRDEHLPVVEKPLFYKSLGFTESTIVLGSVAALFLVFVVIQFQYFFGGQTNIGVEGFTYSQYARRGFNELITVAFFSLVMILGLASFTRRENEIQRRAYSALSVIIVAEVMVILVSAYQRLMLAIDWHGFSRLRLYPSVFLIWIGILLVAVVALEILRREKYFALVFVLASLGFAASLTFVNVDAAIVSHNVDRVVQENKGLNVGHLASLSTDAIPELVERFLDSSYPMGLHEGIGATLVCYLHSDIIRPIDDWRSYNFSRRQASLALNEVTPLLMEYRYNASKRPVQVRTPGKAIYECVESGSMYTDD